MKEISTHKTFEKKIRIYDVSLLQRLDKFLDEHRKLYRNNVNEIIVHLIRNGLEVEEISEQNYNDYFGKFETISTKLTELQTAIANSNYSNQYNIKDLVCNIIIQQKLLARIYNLALAQNDHRTLKEDFIKAGFYDDLPEDLTDIYEDLTEHYGKVIESKEFGKMQDENWKIEVVIENL